MGKLIDPERLKSRLESYAETYKSVGMDVPYDMAVVTDIIRYLHADTLIGFCITFQSAL